MKTQIGTKMKIDAANLEIQSVNSLDLLFISSICSLSFLLFYESNDIWSSSSTRARQRRYFVRRSVAVSVARFFAP